MKTKMTHDICKYYRYRYRVNSRRTKKKINYSNNNEATLIFEFQFWYMANVSIGPVECSSRMLAKNNVKYRKWCFSALFSLSTKIFSAWLTADKCLSISGNVTDLWTNECVDILAKNHLLLVKSSSNSERSAPDAIWLSCDIALVKCLEHKVRCSLKNEWMWK